MAHQTNIVKETRPINALFVLQCLWWQLHGCAT